MIRYFEWMGAAVYTADHRAGAMHGKQFLLDSVHAGIDQTNLYGRLDFKGKISSTPFELVVNLESWAEQGQRPRRALRIDVAVEGAKIQNWNVTASDEEIPLQASDPPSDAGAKLALQRNFEFSVPLTWLSAAPVSAESARQAKTPAVTRLRLRVSLWQNRLPVDALPMEGWIELHLLEEGDLMSMF